MWGGKKTRAQFQVNYIGVGVGLEIDFTGSMSNSFIDGNANPDPENFNVDYIEVGGGLTPAFGYGAGAASINRGQVRGNLTCPSAGIGVGISELAGSSELSWSTTIDCDNQCDN